MQDWLDEANRGDPGDPGDQVGQKEQSPEDSRNSRNSHERIDRKKADLLSHPALWRAGALIRETVRAEDAVTTGFEVLDRHLPGNGWPRAGLCELLLPAAGIGELRLLLPALKHLSRQARWIAWVNPPFIPYAPALAAAGIDIDKILLIHPRNHKDALWSLERATRSGTCSAALAWLDERELKTKDTQRLQLAARQGGTLSCLFRPQRARLESSMAELRLAVAPDEPASQTLRVSICKRRGGWPIADLPVALVGERRPEEIREQLSLWRQWRAPAPASSTDRVRTPMPLHPAHPDADRHITH